MFFCKMGPSLLVSRKYYIWMRLPQILCLFGLWMAELCRKLAKGPNAPFPSGEPYPRDVLYDRAAFISLPDVM